MTYELKPMEKLDVLLNLWERLADRERSLLLVMGQRLLNGQKKYGPITPGKKTWTYEALEEHLDACVYLAAALDEHTQRAFNAAVADAEKEVQSYTHAGVTFASSDSLKTWQEPAKETWHPMMDRGGGDEVARPGQRDPYWNDGYTYCDIED